MIDLTKQVPDIYVDESRDFQLYLRLLNVIIGGTKFSIDSIVDIFDPQVCNNRVLDLLCTTFNFNPKIKFTDDDLRIILSGFGSLIKNKGTRKGIEQAISLVLKTQNIISDYDVLCFNYYIQITIPVEINRLYLYELLEYVKPVGYTINVHLITRAITGNSMTTISELEMRVNEPQYVGRVSGAVEDLEDLIFDRDIPVVQTEIQAKDWLLAHRESGSNRELVEVGQPKYIEGYDTYKVQNIKYNNAGSTYQLETNYISIPHTPENVYKDTLLRTEVVSSQAPPYEPEEDIVYNNIED